MAYIGKTPTAVPIGTNDLADNIVTVSKLASTLDLSSNTITLPSGVGGKVLQIVTFNNDTAETTTNTSFTGSAKRLSITPSATSSKILIIYSGTSRHNNNSSHCTFTLYRETTSTNLGDGTDGMNQIYNAGGLGYAQLSINYLDSPSTTSAVEYRVYFKSQAGGTEAGIGGGNARSVLTLMEIEG